MIYTNLNKCLFKLLMFENEFSNEFKIPASDLFKHKRQTKYHVILIYFGTLLALVIMSNAMA